MTAKTTAQHLIESDFELKDPFSPQFSPNDHAKGASHFQTSFWFIPSSKRRIALADLYSFCHLVDDIADCESDNFSLKRNYLDEIAAWVRNRKPIQHPFWDRFLSERIEFEIADDTLLGIIEGVKRDVTSDGVRFETWDELNEYVQGVACCVGEATLSVLGAWTLESQNYAQNMGRCLQYLNFMRDIHEDLALNRVYVPRQFLSAIGADPVLHPTEEVFEKIRAEFYRRALNFRKKAKPYSWRCLPAEIMAALYIFGSRKYWRKGIIRRLSAREKMIAGFSGLFQFSKSFFSRSTIPSLSNR